MQHKKIFLYIIMIIIGATTALAADGEWKKEWKKLNNEAVKTLNTMTRGGKLDQKAVDKAIKILNKSLSLAISNKSAYSKAYTYKILGTAYIYDGKPNQVKECFERFLKIVRPAYKSITGAKQDKALAKLARELEFVAEQYDFLKDATDDKYFAKKAGELRHEANSLK